VRELNKLPDTFVAVRHGSVYGTGGHPDIVGCVGGIHLEIEVKVGRNKPTEKQTRMMERWRRAGAVVGVVYTLEEAAELHASAWRLGIELVDDFLMGGHKSNG
tara:strand:- start:4124 stop:4432 length:309 start_codon:yes stop_codon:yes gene_type:complete